MRKLIATLLCALLCAGSALAQSSAGVFVEHDMTLFDFTVNSSRLEGGIILGQAGYSTPYARFGSGAYVLFNGVYVDLLDATPQHRYSNETSDTDWNDTNIFSINAGYQIPVLPWLRIMPLVGYCQTNEGLTEADDFEVDVDDDGASWYHEYDVTPGTRVHHFNYGCGLSIQPIRWLSIHAVASRYAIYGGIGIDFLSFIRSRE